MTTVLFYIHDPMCSWCYGFVPTWSRIKEKLPQDIKVEYLVGGLAPDSDEPMRQTTQKMVMGAWHRIQDMLGAEFNFGFWENNTPRRSTYPSCRAVIAAKAQDFEKEMLWAIQKGYYRRALNPSDNEILIQLATELIDEIPNKDIDIDQFKTDLVSDEIEQELIKQISLARQLTQRGFPSLVLVHNTTAHFIDHDYQDEYVTLNRIDQIRGT